MTEGKIFPQLIRFSIPLILSSVLQLLFNAADLVVVSRFSSENAMGAVGATSSLINLLVNLFLGLSVGCNVVAANFTGARQKEGVVKTVHTAIPLSVISGLVLTLTGLAFTRQILEIMGTPENILPLSALYLKIYFGGITATVVYNFGAAILRAKGDTRRPLYILLTAGVINVILNVVFVLSFEKENAVAGVAFATVISQLFSAACVIFLLIHEEDEFRLILRKMKIYKPVLLRILKIGVPAGLQSAIFSLSNIVIQSTVNEFGEVYVDGNSACQSVEGFIYTSMNSVAQSSLTFTGQNMGAHNFDRIKRGVRTCLLSVTVIGLVMGNLAVIFGEEILGIYSSSPQIIAAARERLLVIGASYFTCGIMDVVANSIRGMGYSFLPMIVTLLGACGLRLIYLFTVFRTDAVYSYQNIFLSYPLSWVVTFTILMCTFVSVLKKNILFSEKN